MEDRVKIKIGERSEIEIDRIIFINPEERPGTKKKTCEWIVLLCCEITDSVKENAITEAVIEKIVSSRKLFPRAGPEWKKETIASSRMISIGHKEYYAIEIMTYRLFCHLERKYSYDEVKAEEKVIEQGVKMMQKAFSVFNWEFEKASIAFDKIFK